MNCPKCEKDGRRTTAVKMDSVQDPNYSRASGITMFVCPSPNCECTLRMSDPITGRYDIEENC